ncbi:hypothetical protein [Streptomyces sp. NPDC003395]
MTAEDKTTDPKGTVYALIDPRDGATRYIGQTTRTLTVRLAGHLTNPAPKVAPWVKELADAGMQPDISPLRSNVPVGELLAVEREEITRRLLNGEQLLNEASTGKARKVLRQREADARKERYRAAWEHIAHQTRQIVGGPLAPGHLPPPDLPEGLWERLPDVWDTQEYLEQRAAQQPAGTIDTDGIELEVRLLDVQNRLSSALSERVLPAWPRLWCVDDDQTADTVETLVQGVISIRTSSPQDAARLIALTPWCVVAVSPWASLAQRAGISLDPDNFIPWVSDDPEVHEALRFATGLRPHLLETLARMDPPHDRMRTADYLAFTAAAHAPFSILDELHHDAHKLLSEVGRQRMLTAPMAALLAGFDPGALDALFGKDLAALADADLGLPPGTAAAVLAHVLENGPGTFGTLDRVVVRASGKLPTRYPDYSSWRGKSVRRVEALVYTLVGAGLLEPPAGQTRADIMEEARAMWRPDITALSRL